MKIGLDWDNTFTKDTHFWQKFITMAALADHEVYITTARGPDTSIEFVPHNLTGVVYCDYKAKKQVTESRGIDIDIWIDDDPKWITQGFVNG